MNIPKYNAINNNIVKKRKTIAEEIHIPSDAQIRGLEEGLLEYHRL